MKQKYKIVYTGIAGGLWLLKKRLRFLFWHYYTIISAMRDIEDVRQIRAKLIEEEDYNLSNK